MNAMFDPRILYDRRSPMLGEPAPIDPSSRADLHQQPECLDPSHPLSNYCTGRLDGWVRIFTRAGFPLSNPDLTLPVEERPTGPVPTLKEWAAFDSEASRRGVAGYVNMIKKNATPSTDFASVFSRALSQIGRSIERFQLDKALKGGNLALKSITDEVDKVVPGAGGILGNVLLNALIPIFPFAPVLVSTLSTVAGNIPFAGGVLGPLVSTAGSAGQSFTSTRFDLGGAATGPQTTFDIPTQQTIGNAVLQSASDVATGAAADLGYLKDTLVRLVDAYKSTNGDLAAKLEAVTFEALRELSAAVTIACLLASAGTACSAIAAGVNAGLTLDQALLKAQALKDQASSIKQAAYDRARALDDEAAALQNEIARLEAENGQTAARDKQSLGILAWIAAEILVGRLLL